MRAEMKMPVERFRGESMSMKRAMVLVLAALAAAPACKGESDAARAQGNPGGQAGAAGAGGRGDGAGGRGRAARAFPVQVQPVGARDVAYMVSAVGTVEAFEEIQVTSRVTGVVEKVRFSEGQSVKGGQPLVEIEPRRFQLAVESARAALAKTRAAMGEAQAGLARREKATVDNPGLVPGEELETWRTRVATARAEVNAARVALDRAELDRRDASVHAPVAGVLQTRSVRTGQYVQPGTVLATLIQRDPLLLRFDVPEREAAGLRPGMKVVFGGGAGEEPYSAVIKLVTTAADPSTRMVKVTAEVDDPRKATLRAGSFARVAVQMGTSTGAVVIPQTAIRPSEKGFLAYVVADGVAAERALDLGLHTSDGMIEVKRGLKIGEQLVVRGAEALRNGVQVSVTGQVPSGQALPEDKAAAGGKAPTPAGGEGQAAGKAAPGDRAPGESQPAGGARGRSQAP
jgi:membrane fusion protein, multidrug efflux system